QKHRQARQLHRRRATGAMAESAARSIYRLGAIFVFLPPRSHFLNPSRPPVAYSPIPRPMNAPSREPAIINAAVDPFNLSHSDEILMIPSLIVTCVGPTSPASPVLQVK